MQRLHTVLISLSILLATQLAFAFKANNNQLTIDLPAGNALIHTIRINPNISHYLFHCTTAVPLQQGRIIFHTNFYDPKRYAVDASHPIADFSSQPYYVDHAIYLAMEVSKHMRTQEQKNFDKIICQWWPAKN